MFHVYPLRWWATEVLLYALIIPLVASNVLFLYHHVPIFAKNHEMPAVVTSKLGPGNWDSILPEMMANHQPVRSFYLAREPCTVEVRWFAQEDSLTNLLLRISRNPWDSIGWQSPCWWSRTKDIERRSCFFSIYQLWPSMTMVNVQVVYLPSLGCIGCDGFAKFLSSGFSANNHPSDGSRCCHVMFAYVCLSLC